jgi:hypothetical protein
MPATTTKVGIVNRALQKLGQPQIASLNENSIGAKAMLRAYDSLFLAELRKNVWKFAIKRASLAASFTAPLFGKAYQYPLPGDWVRMAPEETTYNNPTRRDWEIEGLNIVSDDGAPLPIRYVSSSITESNFDALFAEAFASRLAMETCEELTNSTSKYQLISGDYKDSINSAKKTNSIENAPVKSPTCSWISVRG